MYNGSWLLPPPACAEACIADREYCFELLHTKCHCVLRGSKLTLTYLLTYLLGWERVRRDCRAEGSLEATAQSKR